MTLMASELVWRNDFGFQEVWDVAPPGSGLNRMAYVTIRKLEPDQRVYRTAVFDEQHGILVDLDSDGKILGIEKILGGEITMQDMCLVLSLIKVDPQWPEADSETGTHDSGQGDPQA